MSILSAVPLRPLEPQFLTMPRLLPKALFVLAALSGLVGPASALEPKWPLGPYKYLVIDQDVKDVLSEFGRNIGVPVDVSNEVTGRLRGRLPMVTAKDFLDKLCDSYGLVWYFDGSTLHVNTRSEVKTELIDIGRLPSNQLTARLTALGIADPRFPVRSTPHGGVVSVSGPPSYIALVRRTLTAMARAAVAPQDMRHVTIWRDLKAQQYDLPEE